jgi:C-3',4' desaturase CrtD
MSKILILGSGMGSLSAACLLVKDGHEVQILEQNYLPGGCSSSYYRQGYIFESGATTLVGLDKGMPLRYLFDEIGLNIDKIQLETPMMVRLHSGEMLTRYQDLDQWITEAERVFGKSGQREFWTKSFEISQFVWRTSLNQLSFPPSSWKDLIGMLKGFKFEQLKNIPYVNTTVLDMLKKYSLDKNQKFVDFVNEQLIITAQNHASEVNFLFGATALCYTNYGNYYVFGGMIQMVNAIVDWLKERKAEIQLRTKVLSVHYQNGQYNTITDKGNFVSDKIIFGIPINNVLEIYDDKKLVNKFSSRLLKAEKLNSAFQIGIGFKRNKELNYECLHHQIHLLEALPEIQAKSIFLSYSHPIDWYRSNLDHMVASISCHIPNPDPSKDIDKEAIAEIILVELDRLGFIKRSEVEYFHVSGTSAWERWTGRKYGFVGGYPQYKEIKPWMMLDARLDRKGAYLCGDSAYPGQGIPGVALSGIIAYNKIKIDSSL